MAAGVTEAFFKFAGSQGWINGVGARTFPKFLCGAGRSFGVFLHALEKLFGLGKFAGLEKIPDGWRKIEDGKLLFT